MDKYDLLKIIYAKYNELDSLKEHVKDETALAIISAKQDTLNDMIEIVK